MNSYGPTFVSASWLEDHLGDPEVAVIDVRAGFRPQPPGPSDFFSMRTEYDETHIPGAHYLHMVDDLSDPAGPFPFAALAATDVHDLLGAMGVSNDQTLVLYGANMHVVTHRCWWSLRQAGANNVRLLDGTYDHWVQGGRPVTDAIPENSPCAFVATEIPEWIADKEVVAAAVDDPTVGLVNALSHEQFEGDGQHYGRPGRIPGSVSVPAMSVIDPSTGALRERSELETVFHNAGADGFERLITYCGGGIAASTTFLALDVLGYDNVSLYDGSLLEWTKDPQAPLDVGPA
ncbi:MAG: sulfurtransferase [Acidimicrobiales bacterium]|jgi:thiosulfate/3-mercaptopyruvate sulfurtransferase|nr:sulfurtransferase [Acidimicrobiales bacterium]